MSHLFFSQLIPEFVIPEGVTALGIRGGVAIAIFLAGKWGAGLVSRLTRRALTKTTLDATLVLFASNFAYYGVLAFTILAVLGQLGIETTSLVAVLGTAGLAVGLALQGSLSNFAAGILLILFRPFSIGDWIEVNGVSGTVADMQMLTTALQTPDGRVITIPNSKLTEDNLVNYSTKKQLRVDLVVGIAYDANLKHAKHIIQDVLANTPCVLQEPKPTVGVLELADSSVNLAIRPWSRPAHYWDVYFSVYEAVKIRLDEVGIGIPFPQQEIRVLNMPAEEFDAPTPKEKASNNGNHSKPATIANH